MKNLLLASLVALIPTAIVTPQPARADDCNDSTSYVQMPNRKCYRLSYMAIAAASRSNTASAQQSFQRQFRDNVILDTSESFRKNETKEERDERYKNLAQTKISLDKMVVSNQEIESWAFTQHLRVLNAVRGQLTPRRGVSQHRHQLPQVGRTN